MQSAFYGNIFTYFPIDPVIHQLSRRKRGLYGAPLQGLRQHGWRLVVQRSQQLWRPAVDLLGQKQADKRLGAESMARATGGIENILLFAHCAEYRQEVIGAADITTPTMLDT